MASTGANDLGMAAECVPVLAPESASAPGSSGPQDNAPMDEQGPSERLLDSSTARVKPAAGPKASHIPLLASSWRGVGVGVSKQGVWLGAAGRHDRALMLDRTAPDDVEPSLLVQQQVAFWEHVVGPFFRPIESRALNVVRYLLERGLGEAAADTCAVMQPPTGHQRSNVHELDVSAWESAVARLVTHSFADAVPSNLFSIPVVQRVLQPSIGDAPPATIRVLLRGPAAAATAYATFSVDDNSEGLSRLTRCTLQPIAADEPNDDSDEIVCELVKVQRDLILARKASCDRLLRLFGRVQSSRQADAAITALGLHVELPSEPHNAVPVYARFPLARNVRPWNDPRAVGSGEGSLAYLASRAAAIPSSSLTGLEPGETDARGPMRDSPRIALMEGVLESLYAWRRVAVSVEAGARDRQPGFTAQADDSSAEPLPASWLLAVEGRPLPVAAAATATQPPHADAALGPQSTSHADDAVCSVCWDWRAPEENELLSCDRCDVTVHRLCYGVTTVPEGDWLCAACAYTVKAGLARSSEQAVECALCPIDGGALKRTCCGRWAHVACALWTPGCWVVSLVRMEPIEIRPAHAALLRARAVTSHAELAALLQSGGAARSDDEASEAESDDDDTTAALLEQRHPEMQLSAPAAPCCVCDRSLGRTVRCAEAPCAQHLHPLCAWYAGLHLSVRLRTRAGDLFYAGGGSSGARLANGMAFDVRCPLHEPATPARSAELQRAIRAVARKGGGSSSLRARAKKGAAAGGRPPQGRALASAAPTATAARQQQQARPSAEDAAAESRPPLELRKGGAVAIDSLPPGLCAVCFESAPGDESATCVSCRVRVHPRCYGGPAGASALSSLSFTCARCEAVASCAPAPSSASADTSGAGAEAKAAARGLVLFSAPPPLLDAQCCVCLRRGGALKPLRRRPAWAHIFCALQMPRATFYFPDRHVGIDFTSVEHRRWAAISGRHCDICNKGVGALVECDACRVPFHSMCAALAGRHFSWREGASGGLEPVAFCGRHGPPASWGAARADASALEPPAITLGDLPEPLLDLIESRRRADLLGVLLTRVRKRERLKRSVLRLLELAWTTELEDLLTQATGGEDEGDYYSPRIRLRRVAGVADAWVALPVAPGTSGCTSVSGGAQVPAPDEAESQRSIADYSPVVRLRRVAGSTQAWVVVAPVASGIAAGSASPCEYSS